MPEMGSPDASPSKRDVVTGRDESVAAPAGSAGLAVVGGRGVCEVGAGDAGSGAAGEEGGWDWVGGVDDGIGRVAAR